MPDPFDLSRLLKAAQAAPSILNTQPWLFRPVADDRIQLCADPRPDPNYPRGRELHLKVTDKRAREMVISCGAALFNLLLAIRVTGHDPVVDVVQGQDVAELLEGQAKDPVLLATVEIGINRYRATTRMEQHLYDAIQLRHTIREPFGPPKLEMNLVTHLEQAGRMGPVNARLLRRWERREFVNRAADVNRRLKKDDDYKDELRKWTGPNAVGGRGVPEAAFGPLPEDEDQSPIRDLGLAWRGRGGRKRARFEEENARLIVLTTQSDTTADWMYAGQALQRLLLTATHFGVQASFMTQPFEELDRRREERRNQLRPWPWPRPWHIVIRLGRTRERHGTPHVKFQDIRTAQTPSIPGGIPRDAPSS